MKPTPIANRATAKYGFGQSTNAKIRVATIGTNKPIELNNLRAVFRLITCESISLSLIKPDITAHDQHDIYGNVEKKPF